jgi:hypothetical protein
LDKSPSTIRMNIRTMAAPAYLGLEAAR